MDAAAEAQALAYRLRWRQRQAAQAALRASLRGNPAARVQLTDRWRPWLGTTALPVGDEDERQKDPLRVNG